MRRVLGFAPFVLPLLLLLPEGGYVPIFDGREYANCLSQLAAHPSLDGLGCAGHPTHAYALFTAAFMVFSPYSTWLLLLAHVALLLAGIWAFGRVLSHLFPSDDEWGVRLLATTALAAHPAILGCTLQPNPDLAALTGSLLVLEALLAKRLLRATAAAFFLAFTKEVGLLYLPAIVAAYALVFVSRSPAPLRDRGRALVRLWPLALPLLAAIGRLAFRHYGHQAVFYVPPTHSNDSSDILAEFLSVQLLDRTFLSYASGIGVLQFQWVQTALVLGWTGFVAVRWCFRLPTAREPSDAPAAFLSWVLAFAFFVLTTRYRTYSSPRYWLAAYPMLMLATFAAVRELGLPLAARHGVFAFLALAFLGSEFRVIDPVSRRLYGTFRAGEHDMLRASSISRYPSERSAGGRDALTYNLQYVNLHYLQNAVAANVPMGVTPLVDVQSDWHLWDTFDATNRRTLDPRGRTRPYVRLLTTGNELQLVPVGLERPTATYAYVTYPMFDDYQRLMLSALAKNFDVGPAVKVEADGYGALIHPVRLRAVAPAP